MTVPPRGAPQSDPTKGANPQTGGREYGVAVDVLCTLHVLYGVDSKKGGHLESLWQK